MAKKDYKEIDGTIPAQSARAVFKGYTSKIGKSYRAKGRILRGGIVDVSSSEVAKTEKFNKLLGSYQPKKLVSSS